MKVNISYLEYHKPLKHNMYATSFPLYRNIDIDWDKLHRLVTSDFRQYSPYLFRNRKKKGINWNNDNQNLLIFDIDDGMTIEDCEGVLNKFKYLITTTKSHRQLKGSRVADRYRVILPASNIPTDEKLYFEMLDVIRTQLPDIDPQPNCKSGAFLGNSKAINIYHDGEIFDCEKAVEIARYRLSNKEKIKQKLSEDRVKYTYDFDLDINKIKSSLTTHCLYEILESLGYELEGNKFKLRDDERTPSCTIFNDCKMKDFGGDFNGDIFDLLTSYHDMSFKDSLNYVNNFLKEFE